MCATWYARAIEEDAACSIYLNKTNIKTPHAYNSEKELLNDLYLIKDSLISDNDNILNDFGLNDFIRLVETFGFYLVNLDIREESTNHTNAISEILKKLFLKSQYYPSIH